MLMCGDTRRFHTECAIHRVYSRSPVHVGREHVLQEVGVEPEVPGQFRVEGRRHEPTLPHRHHPAVHDTSVRVCASGGNWQLDCTDCSPTLPRTMEMLRNGTWLCLWTGASPGPRRRRCQPSEPRERG